MILQGIAQKTARLALATPGSFARQARRFHPLAGQWDSVKRDPVNSNLVPMVIEQTVRYSVYGGFYECPNDHDIVGSRGTQLRHLLKVVEGESCYALRTGMYSLI
jgi:hypothetical protein